MNQVFDRNVSWLLERLKKLWMIVLSFSHPPLPLSSLHLLYLLQLLHSPSSPSPPPVTFSPYIISSLSLWGCLLPFPSTPSLFLCVLLILFSFVSSFPSSTFFHRPLLLCFLYSTQSSSFSLSPSFPPFRSLPLSSFLFVTPPYPLPILSFFFLFLFLQPPNRKTNGRMPCWWFIAFFLPLPPPVPGGGGVCSDINKARKVSGVSGGWWGCIIGSMSMR